VVVGNVPTIVIGDLNSMALGESRFNANTGKFQKTADVMERHIQAALRDFAEVHQRDYTRIGNVGGLATHYSRIDRMFVRMSSLDLADLAPCGQVWKDINERGLISDHLPVSFVFRAPREQLKQDINIPEWDTKAPSYRDLLHTLLKEREVDSIDDVSKHMLAMKAALHDVAFIVRQQLALCPPSSSAERLHWAMKWCRAVQCPDYASLCKAAAAFPELAQYMEEVGPMVLVRKGAFAAACKFVAKLTVVRAEEEGKALDASAEQGPAKVLKKQRVDDRIRLWRQSHRRTAFSGIKQQRADGSFSIAESPAASAKLVRDYWAPIFGASLTVPGDQDLLLGLVPEVDGSTAVLPSVDEIAQLIAAKTDSAPGPDGLRFSALAAAGSSGVAALHSALQQVFRGGCFPDDSRHSLMVMVPKALDDDRCALPGDLRPLSLSNTDAKIWASILNRMLVPLVEGMIGSEQKGFMRGRGRPHCGVGRDGFRLLAAVPAGGLPVLGHQGGLPVGVPSMVA
jgi:hypothetical protein